MRLTYIEQPPPISIHRQHFHAQTEWSSELDLNFLIWDQRTRGRWLR